MAPKSDNLAGPLDMGRLLDLLNSSEGHDEDTDNTQPVPSIQQALSNSGEPPSVPAPPDSVPAPRDTINSPADPKETVENRFAAHIVHGMSKRRQS
jgi:hypothetical protein